MSREGITLERVAIIGNAAGGKSRLAHTFASVHELPICSVDRYQWRPGWETVPESEVTNALDAIVSEKRWVIDGWGPWPTIERRFAAADLIVLVDHPLWIHFWWAAERQIECAKGIARPDGPQGCDMLDVTPRLFKMIWEIDKVAMPRLRTLADRFEGDGKVRRIRSPEELDAFAHSMQRRIAQASSIQRN